MSRKRAHPYQSIPTPGVVNVHTVSFSSNKKARSNGSSSRRLGQNAQRVVTAQPLPSVPSELDQSNLIFEPDDLHSALIAEEVEVTVKPPRKGASKSVSVSKSPLQFQPRLICLCRRRWSNGCHTVHNTSTSSYVWKGWAITQSLPHVLTVHRQWPLTDAQAAMATE